MHPSSALIADAESTPDACCEQYPRPQPFIPTCILQSIEMRAV